MPNQPAAATGSARAQSQGQSSGQTPISGEELAKIEEAYNCYSDSDWSKGSDRGTGGERKHGLSKCGQDWAIRNANEMIALRTYQVNLLQADLEAAKNSSNQADRDRMQQKLATDRMCDTSESFDSCYDRVRRQILTQTAHLRESTIRNNTARHELGAGHDARVAAPSASENEQLSQGAQNQDRAKMAFQLIQEQRQQKVPTGSNGQRRLSPCAQNPFIPCEVSFGKGSYDNNVGKEPNAAVSQFLAAPTLTNVKAIQLQDEKNPDYVEISTNEENAKFRAQMEKEMKDPQSAFNRKHFQADIEYAKQVQKQLDDRDRVAKDNRAYNPELYRGDNNQRSAQSASWSTFNAAMDSLEKQRKDEQKKGLYREGSSFMLQVQADDAKAGARRPSAVAGKASSSQSSTQRVLNQSNGQSQSNSNNRNLSADSIINESLQGTSVRMAP